MKIFRKLIRDKAPELFAKEGKKVITRELSKEEFAPALENKLLEEVQELREVGAHKADKIAYCYEILETLSREYTISIDEIARIRKAQLEQKGGFTKRLFLEGEEKQ